MFGSSDLGLLYLLLCKFLDAVLGLKTKIALGLKLVLKIADVLERNSSFFKLSGVFWTITINMPDWGG